MSSYLEGALYALAFWLPVLLAVSLLRRAQVQRQYRLRRHLTSETAKDLGLKAPSQPTINLSKKPHQVFRKQTHWEAYDTPTFVRRGRASPNQQPANRKRSARRRQSAGNPSTPALESI
ncbi:MAG: hypothetical protein V2J55_04635 [Candidatus Competibacteraceae bacterium]|jgi:hypothetical protein|nr:hypothetical protein [Candidatus Competibacteraceae bacterium]